MLSENSVTYMYVTSTKVTFWPYLYSGVACGYVNHLADLQCKHSWLYTQE